MEGTNVSVRIDPFLSALGNFTGETTRAGGEGVYGGGHPPPPPPPYLNDCTQIALSCSPIGLGPWGIVVLAFDVGSCDEFGHFWV